MFEDSMMGGKNTRRNDFFGQMLMTLVALLVGAVIGFLIVYITIGPYSFSAFGIFGAAIGAVIAVSLILRSES